MKIDTTKSLVDMDGNVLIQPKQGPKDADGHAEVIQEELKVREILVNALLAEDPKNPTPGTEKLKLFKLAQRINDNDEVTLESEEVTLIKNRVLTGFTVLIAGQVVILLEGDLG
ncbi:hypothetical protein LCGC14_0356380 [marine sediment metagenome]|uniref:Uncharacterized protein n=1 Tax=marine sediment metagenome TaxID=412755 RepID=A0A0F9VWR8_9ZZZZ